MTATDETPVDAPLEPAPDAAPDSPFAEPDEPDAPSVFESRVTEYGRFNATTPLYVDGVLAFTAGGPVPMSHPWLVEGRWGAGWIAEGMVTDRFPDAPLPGA